MTASQDAAPGRVSTIDRRALIRRAAATGVVVWTTPVIAGSFMAPAGAITGGPPSGGPTRTSCRTVSNNTVVTFTVPTGYQFVGSAALTSCASSVTLSAQSATSVTLSFAKQSLHWVYLLVETVPAGGCYLYVYNVTSPNPNGSLCDVYTLLSEADCATPALSGAGAACTPERIGP